MKLSVFTLARRFCGQLLLLTILSRFQYTLGDHVLHSSASRNLRTGHATLNKIENTKTKTENAGKSRELQSFDPPDSNPTPTPAPVLITPSPVTPDPVSSSPIVSNPETSSPLTSSPATSPVTSSPATSPVTPSPVTASPITSSPVTPSPVMNTATTPEIPFLGFPIFDAWVACGLQSSVRPQLSWQILRGNCVLDANGVGFSCRDTFSDVEINQNFATCTTPNFYVPNPSGRYFQFRERTYQCTSLLDGSTESNPIVGPPFTITIENMSACVMDDGLAATFPPPDNCDQFTDDQYCQLWNDAQAFNIGVIMADRSEIPLVNGDVLELAIDTLLCVPDQTEDTDCTVTRFGG